MEHVEQQPTNTTSAMITATQIKRMNHLKKRNKLPFNSVFILPFILFVSLQNMFVEQQNSEIIKRKNSESKLMRCVPRWLFENSIL